MFGIHWTKGKRFKLWVLGIVTTFEGLVTVLTLGFFSPEWRGPLLFSEWMDDA